MKTDIIIGIIDQDTQQVKGASWPTCPMT